MFWSFKRSSDDGVVVVRHVDDRMEDLPYGRVTSVARSDNDLDVLVSFESRQSGITFDISMFMEYEDEFRTFFNVVSSTEFVKRFTKMEEVLTPLAAKDPYVYTDSENEEVNDDKPSQPVKPLEDSSVDVSTHSGFYKCVVAIRNSLYVYHDVSKANNPPKHTKAWLKNDLPDLLRSLPDSRHKKKINKWSYYPHLKLAEMNNDLFGELASLDMMYTKGKLRGQGLKREMKSGLFQNLRGTVDEDELKKAIMSLKNRDICIDEFKQSLLKCRVKEWLEDGHGLPKLLELKNKLKESEIKIKEQLTPVSSSTPHAPCRTENSRTENSRNESSRTETGEESRQVMGKEQRKRKPNAKQKTTKRRRICQSLEEKKTTIRTCISDEEVAVDDWIVTLYDELCVGRVIKINGKVSVVHFLHETVVNQPAVLSRNDKQKVKEDFIICKISVSSEGDHFRIDQHSWNEAEIHGRCFKEQFDTM